MRVTAPIDITFELLPDWYDVTDDIPGESVPFTLGRKQGSGALQFTVGLFRSGKVPNPSPEHLRRLLLDFSSARGFGMPSDIQTEATPLRLAAATFHPEFFVRVWYISDGRSIAMVTLTCDPVPDLKEIADCEYMLRSIHFNSTHAA